MHSCADELSRAHKIFKLSMANAANKPRQNSYQTLNESKGMKKIKTKSHIYIYEKCSVKQNN